MIFDGSLLLKTFHTEVADSDCRKNAINMQNETGEKPAIGVHKTEHLQALLQLVAFYPADFSFFRHTDAHFLQIYGIFPAIVIFRYRVNGFFGT